MMAELGPLKLDKARFNGDVAEDRAGPVPA